jgi:hypothetical protein
MTTCFISHTTKDRKFVEGELLGLLEALNIEPWYSRQDISAASEWEPEIRKALEASSWFLVVVSPSSAASYWVRREVAWAMANLHGRIIPVLLEDTQLDDLHVELNHIQLLDFRRNKNSGRNELIRLVLQHSMRQSALEGEWRGVANQPHSPFGPARMEVKLTLKFVGRVLRGTFHIVVQPPARQVQLDFYAACDMFFERFIQLNYRSKDTAMLQFGAIVLEMDDTGNTLKGSYVGYGAISQQLVSGDMELEKVGL